MLQKIINYSSFTTILFMALTSQFYIAIKYKEGGLELNQYLEFIFNLSKFSKLSINFFIISLFIFITACIVSLIKNNNKIG